MVHGVSLACILLSDIPIDVLAYSIVSSHLWSIKQHAHTTCISSKTLIGMHEMHGRMHSN